MSDEKPVKSFRLLNDEKLWEKDDVFNALFYYQAAFLIQNKILIEAFNYMFQAVNLDH